MRAAVVSEPQQATRFCAENGLYGDSTRESLVDHMEEAVAGPAQAPESEEIGTEDATQQRTDHHGPPEVDQRLDAILHLQKTRARVMQESTVSFEQVRDPINCYTCFSSCKVSPALCQGFKTLDST